MRILFQVMTVAVLMIGCSRPASLEHKSPPRGEIEMTSAEFRAAVLPGMSTGQVLKRCGFPRLHYGPGGIVETRTNETGTIQVPILYWEYRLLPSSTRMAVIFSTNGVVERITDELRPEPMSV